MKLEMEFNSFVMKLPKIQNSQIKVHRILLVLYNFGFSSVDLSLVKKQDDGFCVTFD